MYQVRRPGKDISWKQQKVQWKGLSYLKDERKDNGASEVGKIRNPVCKAKEFGYFL
jgi:hypothetical protein